MLCQASASTCSASAIELWMSAKSTVTCLRSPSRVARAGQDLFGEMLRRVRAARARGWRMAAAPAAASGERPPPRRTCAVSRFRACTRRQCIRGSCQRLIGREGESVTMKDRSSPNASLKALRSTSSSRSCTTASTCARRAVVAGRPPGARMAFTCSAAARSRAHARADSAIASSCLRHGDGGRAARRGAARQSMVFQKSAGGRPAPPAGCEAPSASAAASAIATSSRPPNPSTKARRMRRAPARAP